jgi:hypothetical protein
MMLLSSSAEKLESSYITIDKLIYIKYVQMKMVCTHENSGMVFIVLELGKEAHCQLIPEV